MNYSWPLALKEFKTQLLSNLVFEGKDKEYARQRVYMMLHETDTFHPWNTDGELCLELGRMPARCNYRNLDSYWAWKDGVENVLDALYQCFEESFGLIVDYMDEKMNFGPGDHATVKITARICWEDFVSRARPKIIKACALK